MLSINLPSLLLLLATVSSVVRCADNPWPVCKLDDASIRTAKSAPSNLGYSIAIISGKSTWKPGDVVTFSVRGKPLKQLLFYVTTQANPKRRLGSFSRVPGGTEIGRAECPSDISGGADSVLVHKKDITTPIHPPIIGWNSTGVACETVKAYLGVGDGKGKWERVVLDIPCDPNGKVDFSSQRKQLTEGNKPGLPQLAASGSSKASSATTAPNAPEGFDSLPELSLEHANSSGNSKDTASTLPPLPGNAGTSPPPLSSGPSSTTPKPASGSQSANATKPASTSQSANATKPVNTTSDSTTKPANTTQSANATVPANTTQSTGGRGVKDPSKKPTCHKGSNATAPSYGETKPEPSKDAATASLPTPQAAPVPHYGETETVAQPTSSYEDTSSSYEDTSSSYGEETSTPAQEPASEYGELPSMDSLPPTTDEPTPSYDDQSAPAASDNSMANALTPDEAVPADTSSYGDELPAFENASTENTYDEVPAENLYGDDTQGQESDYASNEPVPDAGIGDYENPDDYEGADLYGEPLDTSMYDEPEATASYEEPAIGYDEPAASNEESAVSYDEPAAFEPSFPVPVQQPACNKNNSTGCPFANMSKNCTSNSGSCPNGAPCSKPGACTNSGTCPLKDLLNNSTDGSVASAADNGSYGDSIMMERDSVPESETEPVPCSSKNATSRCNKKPKPKPVEPVY